LWAILALFGVSAAVITVVGVRIARVADRLADVTGWGEAIFGAVLLGGATSLPGIVTSVTTAWH
jgi:cation:H+ antiporter